MPGKDQKNKEWIDAIRSQSQTLMAASSIEGKQTQSESELTKLIAACKKQMQMLYEKLVREEITPEEYKETKVQYETELDRLSHNHIALKQEKVKMATALMTENLLREVSETVLKENKLSRLLVDLLIDKVSIYPGGKVTVAWKVEGFDCIFERGDEKSA
jgi:hypothetical protein